MINARILAIAFAAGTAFAPPSFAQTSDSQARADFARGVQSYVELRERVARTVPPIRTSTDPGEIHRAGEALAAAIQQARAGARQGDIFTPEIVPMIRRAVRSSCQENYAELLTVINEDLETPLPAPTIHGRWPMGAPLPTMLPGLLASLPRLPPGLEYRFMNRALVLRDIDANLILDFVPGVIPAITTF